MKKKKQIIVTILFAMILLNGCSNDKTLKDLAKNKNYRVTSDYICHDIQNKDILFYWGNGKVLNINSPIILSDGSIYETSFETPKIYSTTNQNCRKIGDDNLKIINVFYDNSGKPLFIDDKNDIYFIEENEIKKLDITKTDLYNYYNYKENNPDIEKIFIYNDYDNKVFLKKDGSLYVEYKNHYEELLLDSQKYGKIIDIFEYDNQLTNWSENDEKYMKIQIKSFLSENGYYTYQQIKTDSCLKYEDIKCEYDYVKSEVYEKYKEEIKYISRTSIILKDNNIIPNTILNEKLN